METATDRLGAGNLTGKYDDSGKDEIAHISQILNVMAASLREVMTSIRKESIETAKRAETLVAKFIVDDASQSGLVATTK